ncbi:MAG: hypothetical protein Q9197_002568 [Variospora fuerteventurae]
MGSTSSTTSSPLTALIIGANGYLGSAISSAFLRASNLPTTNFFRVYGLIRRSSNARALALRETIPIVASLSSDSPAAVTKAILAHSRTWDIVVVCTEPSQADPVAQTQHWHDVLALVRGVGGGFDVDPFRKWREGSDSARALVEWWAALNPPNVVRCRMDGALRALKVAGTEDGGLDVVVVRASSLCGYSGSYYGAALEYAAAFAGSKKYNEYEYEAKVLKFTADANTIMHGVHVDDCADAYVALAGTALFDMGTSLDEGSGNDTPKSRRAAIAGQVFNISGRRYETLTEVGAALAAEYGFTGGTQFNVSADNIPEEAEYQRSEFVFGYSQWVSSEKIRALTGWRDKRPLFSENIHAYRLAYEAAKEGGNETVRKRMVGDWGE